MADNILETIRRQMRVSEERIRRSAESTDPGKSMPDDPKAVDAGKSAKSIMRSEQKKTIDVSSGEWSAYGQMTPGFLDEVAEFIDESVRSASEKIRTASASELSRHLQDMETARSLLTQWADSAAYIRPIVMDCDFAELIQKALNARTAEMQRWGIRIEFEDATTGVKNCRYSPALYQALLHVIQYCIEQLRGAGGKAGLAVRVQNSGERMETSFLYGAVSNHAPANLSDSGLPPAGPLRFGNVEFRAAQTLLESIGGTLVLENVSEGQKAIRIRISLSTLSAGSSLKERSRI